MRIDDTDTYNGSVMERSSVRLNSKRKRTHHHQSNPNIFSKEDFSVFSKSQESTIMEPRDYPVADEVVQEVKFL